MPGDLPQLVNYALASNTIPLGGGWATPTITSTASSTWPYQTQAEPTDGAWAKYRQFEDSLRQKLSHPQEEKMAAIAKTNRRVVQVYIIDPDERVPLEQAMLHRGEPRLTDLTDQELFYEIEIKKLLDAHNDTRRRIVDKKISLARDKDVFLEPIRIRDLVMTIVDVAKF